MAINPNPVYKSRTPQVSNNIIILIFGLENIFFLAFPL
jgi:hypothetical protein